MSILPLPMICNYHHLLLLLCLHSLLYATKCAGNAVVECHPHDRSFLLDLKHGFDNIDGNTLVSWKPGSNCCNWEGVTCDPESGLIISLDLSESYLSGNLSSSLFNLTSLQTLNLAFNDFTLFPQSGFEKLTKLAHLNLFGTYTGYQIPVGSISRLTSLISLNLSRECVPAWHFMNFELTVSHFQTLVGNLSNLKELHLDYNKMSSVLNWSRILSTSLPRPQMLSLHNCHLSGEISKELFELKSLTVLDLSNNKKLSGTLPEFSKDSVLQFLDLSWTNISGNLPDSIGNLKYMKYLDISTKPGTGVGGMFSGLLPSSIWNLTLLVHLDLSHNLFRGTIPSSVNLTRLLHLDISHNNFTSAIPTSIGSSAQLDYVDLSWNSFNGHVFPLVPCTRIGGMFYGVLPSSIGNPKYMEYLDISTKPGTGVGGMFSGLLPSSIWNLPLLVHLDLSYNLLSGTIPSYVNLTRLLHLDISHNNFTSVIPTSLGSSVKLDYVDLSRNSFSGPVLSLVPCTRIRVLYLNDNNLTGPIPKSLFSLPSLEILDLSNNRFSCQLEEFSNPSISLNRIDLHNNRLWGQIPRSFFMLPALTSLSLESNCFCGSLVLDTIEMSENLTELNLSNNRLQGQIPLPPPSIVSLDYSHNNFSSFIPSNFFFYLGQTSYLSLASNSLNGEISRCFCKAPLIDLDLSDNFFNGSIPSCLLEVSPRVLNLGGNRLRGTIPHNISEGCEAR